MRDTADCCLEFRPDVVAHVISDREIALLGAETEHVLEGQSLVALVPYLDGTKTADEIVEAASDAVEPAEAYHALEELQLRGYVQPALSAVGHAWSGWSPQLARRIATPGSGALKFAGLGLDAPAVELLEKQLTRPSDTADALPGKNVTVLAVDDYLRPDLAKVFRAASEKGEILLPMRFAGPVVWFGPAVLPGQDFDWPLFIKRHEGVRATDVVVLDATGAFPLRPAQTPPEIVEAAAALAMQFAIRLSVGEEVEAVTGSIWEMDMRSMQTHDHPMPTADHETGPQPRSDGHMPIVLNTCKKQFRLEGGHRICSPKETLERLMPHVDPVSGVVPVLMPSDDTEGLHHYMALQTQLGRGVHHSENRLLGKPQGAEGKGQTDTQAKASCLGEAIERYSCCYSDDIQTRRGRLSDMGAEAIHPNEVQLFSDSQYAHRDQINSESGVFNSVPSRFDPEMEINWTPLWSLNRNTSRWLPTAMCYFNYDTSEGGRVPWFASGNSNGCASGNTLEEAILQGMFELIERDAVAIWWYNRLRRPGVDLASFGDAFFDTAQAICKARGRTLQVLDLTNDLGVPVFASISARASNDGLICLGLGCHLEPRLAISRAITEMFQMLSRDDQLDDVRSFSDDPEFISWCENVTLQTDPYLAADPAAMVDAGTHSDQSHDDIAQDVRHCVDKLAASGLETLVLNHTRPDLGFPAARVVVPGLRHFWTRFAPGRLYDVPVDMGWRKAPLTEQDLNPNKFIW